MISGAHVIIYSNDADADRVFFRDVLQFPAVDAGRGWLIFALPPASLRCTRRGERLARAVSHVPRLEGCPFGTRSQPHSI